MITVASHFTTWCQNNYTFLTVCTLYDWVLTADIHVVGLLVQLVATIDWNQL